MLDIITKAFKTLSFLYRDKFYNLNSKAITYQAFQKINNIYTLENIN